MKTNIWQGSLLYWRGNSFIRVTENRNCHKGGRTGSQAPTELLLLVLLSWTRYLKLLWHPILWIPCFISDFLRPTKTYKFKTSERVFAVQAGIAVVYTKWIPDGFGLRWFFFFLSCTSNILVFQRSLHSKNRQTMSLFKKVINLKTRSETVQIPETTPILLALLRYQQK